jgi:hypothetical protein
LAAAAGVELVQSGAGGVEPGAACGPDEHLGERDRAASEPLIRGAHQRFLGAVVRRVSLVEVSDEHACVGEDHAGQSSRSRSR